MVIIFLLITIIIFLIGFVFGRKMMLSKRWSDVIVSSISLVAAWIILSGLIGLFLLFDDLEGSKDAARAIEHRIETATILMASGFVLIYLFFLLINKSNQKDAI